MTVTYPLAGDHKLELYEPPASGSESMLAGRCPGCHEQTRGYMGHYGCIREIDPEGHVVSGSSYTTAYGHLRCVEKLLVDVVNRLREPTPSQPRPWTSGRQRDAIEFLLAHPDEDVEIRIVSGRGRSRRYDYRLKTEIS